MSHGEYKLRVMRASGCSYADVALEATRSPDTGVVIDVAAVEPSWQAAVLVGIRYAIERRSLVAEARPTNHVTVRKVETSNVDSNQMAVAFASYQAACIAFGLPSDERVRLREDWTYEFPSWRFGE